MVPTDATVHALLLSVSASIGAVLAAAAWRRRGDPGARPFAGMMTCVAIWAGAYAAGLLTHDPGPRMFWERLQWFAIAPVGVFTLLFAVAYTGTDDRLGARRRGLLFVVPAVTILAVWTNGWHGLVWTDNAVVVRDGVALAVQEFGIWYWCTLAYSYGLIAVGSFLLVRLAVDSEYLYLDQSLSLVVGVAVPLLANVVSVLGFGVLPGLDLTPYAFTITGIAFGNALFRSRLFDVVPATRRLGGGATVRDLDDGVIVVDADRLIVYCNRRAAEVFDADRTGLVGLSTAELIDPGALDLDAPDALGEIERNGRVYEIRTSPVTDRHARAIGHTLVLTDVTGQTRRERRLRCQRDELERLDRINTILRGVNSALIGASTREEIDDAVSRRLTETGPYDGARITFGVEESDYGLYPDRPAISTDHAPGPTTADGGDNPAGGRLAVSAADQPRADGGTQAVVPLSHGRTVYGTLVLDSERPDAFDERELAVLDELGATIGRAIYAVQTRRLLAGEGLVELEFGCRGEECPLAAATAATGGVLVLEAAVPAEDALVLYLDGIEGDPVAVRDRLAGTSPVADAEVVGDGADCAGNRTLAVTLRSGTPLFPLLEFGANVCELRVEDGRTRLVVEVTPDADVRTVLERVRAEYPEVDFLAKRECVDSRESDAEDPLELTDRQREVLEAAYRSGYFEWPRESTAEEVADTIGVSSPTLHNHLRKAERRLVETVFESDAPRFVENG